MDLYHIWCDLKPGASDLAFARALSGWMDHLYRDGLIAGYRLTRRKLGLGPGDLGEFHVIVEVRDLAQLDAAFQRAARREGDAEAAHFAANSLIRNARFALYRDFPDPVRGTGHEKF